MLTLKQILSHIFHRELFFYRWIWQMHTFISRYSLIADHFCYLRSNWWLASILIQFQVHTPLRSRCGTLPPETEGSLPASHAEIPGPVPHLGCLKNPQLCQGPGPLESPSSVPDRNRFEAGLQEEGSHDRHFKHRLWSSVHGQTSVRLLVNPGAALVYQLPGNHGSSSSTQSLPARPEGVPCLGLFRQHDSGSLHKPPRGRASVQAGEAACAQHNFRSLKKVHVPSRLDQGVGKDSDEMHSVPTFNRQLAPLVLAGWNAIRSCSCTNVIQSGFRITEKWSFPKVSTKLTQCSFLLSQGIEVMLVIQAIS